MTTENVPLLSLSRGSVDGDIENGQSVSDAPLQSPAPSVSPSQSSFLSPSHLTASPLFPPSNLLPPVTFVPPSQPPKPIPSISPTPSDTVTRADTSLSPVSPRRSASTWSSRNSSDTKTLLEPKFLDGLLSRTWMIHLIAVAFTIVVVQITFRRIYWFDEGNWDSQWMFKLGLSQDVAMNGLQFVAKIHEIIIVASVSAMVMHFCRRMLIGEGIPFGFLTGAYQVSSPEWLFSKNYLWATMPQIGTQYGTTYMSSWRRLLMGIGAAAICIYCNMVGPSSAIVIIPELAWWNISHPFNGSLSVSYLMKSQEENYPRHVTKGNIGSLCGPNDSTSEFILSQCPGSGYDDLSIWAETVAMGGTADRMQVTQRRSSIGRELTSVTSLPLSGQAENLDNCLSVASIPHASMAKLVGAFWAFVSNNEIAGVKDILHPKIHQREDAYSPLVQVQCKAFSYLATTGLAMVSIAQEDPYFGTKAMRNFSAFQKEGIENDWYRSPKSSKRWMLEETYWKRPRNEESLRTTNFTWVDFESQVSEETPSIGSVLEVPMVMEQSLGNGSTIPRQDSLVVPCLMDVRWAKAKMFFDPTSNRFLQHDLSDLTDTFKEFWKQDDKQQDVKPSKSALRTIRERRLSDRNIPISLIWASLLNLPVGNVSARGNMTKIEALFESFIFTEKKSKTNDRSFKPPLFEEIENPTELLVSTGQIAARVLSHVVADGMSRVSYRTDVGLKVRDHSNGNITWVDLTNIMGGAKKEEEQRFGNFTDSMTPYHWDLESYGHGYGLVSKTIIFGVSILLIHVGAVALYTSYILPFRLSKSGWSSKAWGGLDEILSLAINSTKPLSTDVYAGTHIRSRRLFSETARVRERADSHVELVVGEVSGVRDRVRCGKSYH